MKPDSKEKIACGVGVGYLGQHHARIYHELCSSDLIGFYEPSNDAAQKIKDAYGCKRFESLAELGRACDAVSVVCPTDQHADVAIPLLTQGCHLLVENPLHFECGSGENSSKCKGKPWYSSGHHIEHYNPVMEYWKKRL